MRRAQDRLSDKRAAVALALLVLITPVLARSGRAAATRIAAPESLQAPPWRVRWVAAEPTGVAVPGEGGTLYAISRGRLLAFAGDSGRARWATAGGHLGIVGVDGSTVRLHHGDGQLVSVQDTPSAVRTLWSQPLGRPEDVLTVSNTILQAGRLYVVVNSRLLVLNATTGAPLAEAPAGIQPPGRLAAGTNGVLVVGAGGEAAAWRYANDALTRLWSQPANAPAAGATLPAVITTPSQLVAGAAGGLIARDLATGALQWQVPFTAGALAVSGQTLFAAGSGARHTVQAIDLASGRLRWQRTYDTSPALRSELAQWGRWLMVGHVGADPAASNLYALDTDSGAYVWQGNGARGHWPGGGVPLVANGMAFSSAPGYPLVAWEPVPAAGLIDTLTAQPSPMRVADGRTAGTAIGFQLREEARVTVAVWNDDGTRSAVLAWDALFPEGAHQLAFSGWLTGETAPEASAPRVLRATVEVAPADGPAYLMAHAFGRNTLLDMHPHWARDDVSALVGRGLVTGYRDGSFRPDSEVSRAEAAALLTRALGLLPSEGFGPTAFSDLTSHWAAGSVGALAASSLISGYPESDGTFTFRPDRAVSRGEAAAMLARAFRVPAAPESFVTGFRDVHGWAFPYVRALEAAGQMRGYPDESGRLVFGPERGITRAEWATLLMRMLTAERTASTN